MNERSNLEQDFKNKRSDVLDMLNNTEKKVVSTIVSYFSDTSVPEGPWEDLFEALYNSVTFRTKVEILRKVPLIEDYPEIIKNLRRMAEIRNIVAHGMRHMGDNNLYRIGKEKTVFNDIYDEYKNIYSKVSSNFCDIGVKQGHKGKMSNLPSWAKNN